MLTTYEQPSFKQRGKLLVSVMYNYALNFAFRRKQCNAIIENETALGNIYLGAMPMRSVAGRRINHHENIINTTAANQKPLGLVVAAVEDFELKVKSTRVLRPVKQKHWEKKNVTFQQVGIQDFGVNVDHEEMLAAVTLIADTRKQGQSVFVHCKAGRSRSVMVLMCYLLTEYRTPAGKQTKFEAAYTFI